MWGGAAQDELHGPQGRTVLAALALADGPVSADELAERLWDGRRPRAWEGGLRVLVHRLRQALQPVLRSADPVPFKGRCYRLETDHAWIDARAAETLLVHAESEESSGDGRAAGLAHASACITRRSFLPGVDGHWVSQERSRLADLRGRALRCLAGAWLESGNESAAVGVAQEAFELDRMSTRAALTLVQAQLSQGEHAHAMRSLEEHRRPCAPSASVSRRARRPAQAHTGSLSRRQRRSNRRLRHWRADAEMKVIHHVSQIGAPPDRVYARITTQDGLSGWWSTEVAASRAEVGAVVEFTFQSGFNPEMEITELDDGRALGWKCIGGTTRGPTTRSASSFPPRRPSPAARRCASAALRHRARR